MKLSIGAPLLGVVVFASIPTAMAQQGQTPSTPVVTFSEAALPVCNADGAGASVTYEWMVTSKGGNAAVVTGTLDGSEIDLPDIGTGDWQTSGSTKSFVGTYITNVPNGEHTLEVCATQNQNRTGCSTQTINVQCYSPDPCANQQVKGQVPGSKNLCKNETTINFHFTGNFGVSPSLTISNTDGTVLTDSVTRSGDSCEYIYHWKPVAGQPAGSYTFKVEGNGNGLEHGADLICDQPGKN